MKKQLLFLAFFVLAILASITNSYGQVNMPASTRQPFNPGASCTGTNDSPLNPRPGKAYEYGVTIGNGATISGTVTDYQWWATKNKDFVTAGSLPNWSDRLTVGGTPGGLLATGANYGSLTGGTSSMSITWDPLTLANTQYQGASPTFVAVMAQGACANNIQVWEINPQPAFTVDITNIAAGSATAEIYGNTISSCVSDVVSATYSAGVINMDYGKNTLYFEVISANFVGSWTPTITVTGLAAGETASVTIHDSWSDAQTGANPRETLNYATDGLQVGAVPLAAASTVTNTTSGVSVWLAVTVDHNNYESIQGARPITVAVGGMDSRGTFDLANNCTATTGVDTDDNATQGITPRPDIDDTIGDPAIPAPQTFIPKN